MIHLLFESISLFWDESFERAFCFKLFNCQQICVSMHKNRTLAHGRALCIHKFHHYFKVVRNNYGLFFPQKIWLRIIIFTWESTILTGSKYFLAWVVKSLYWYHEANRVIDISFHTFLSYFMSQLMDRNRYTDRWRHPKWPSKSRGTLSVVIYSRIKKTSVCIILLPKHIWLLAAGSITTT